MYYSETEIYTYDHILYEMIYSYSDYIAVAKSFDYYKHV